MSDLATSCSVPYQTSDFVRVISFNETDGSIPLFSKKKKIESQKLTSRTLKEIILSAVDEARCSSPIALRNFIKRRFNTPCTL
jgi:hypothetical protein